MIILYIALSYLVNLGMMIESYSNRPLTSEAWFVWFLSPITFPIIIGINISSKE